MLENMLKNALNKPTVITKEQLDNIMIFMGEAEDGIDVLPIKDYLTIEITNKILELLNEVRKNGREI